VHAIGDGTRLNLHGLKLGNWRFLRNEIVNITIIVVGERLHTVR